MKRVLCSIVLTAAFLIAPGMCWALTPFTDVQSSPVLADIEAVYEKGIMIGTGDNMFSPDGIVNRAQLAACLVKTFELNIPDNQPADSYNDVGNNTWYSDAATITGYNNIFDVTGGRFSPQAAVTRAKIASAITDSFAAKNLIVCTTEVWPNYQDITDLTEKQQSDICFVFNAGIMKYFGNEFKPDQEINREELASILNRTLQTLAVAVPAGEDGYKNPSVVDSTLDVNASVMANQGALAFVRQGLLYALDGETGKVEQLTETGHPRQPVWSSDGQWLAFINVTGKVEDRGSLWLVQRDGSRLHQVQGLPELVCRDCFYWSPANDVLAVTMSDGVWLVPVEGEPERLVQSAGTSHLAWSPDGEYLAYNAALPSDEPYDHSDAIYTIAVAGGQPVQQLIVPQAGAQVIAWWPNGKGLLYWLAPLHSASIAADGIGLMSLGLGDSEPQCITSGLAHRDWQSLTPQGNLLAVKGDGRIAWSNKSLITADLVSGNIQELKNPQGSVAIDPSFSPDGSRFAFVAAKDLGDDVWGFSKPEELADWVATRTLWVGNADGSGAQQLMGAGAGVYQPIWSWDGKHILYVRDNALWIIEANGGEAEKVLELYSQGEDLFGFYGFTSYRDVWAWYQK
ncbi:MAG: hypothetical protein HQP61_03390 [Peptococcaceae bacterium]|nr:hypothetical protein [Candidatus Syntrophopropionicum ammoniitolerans]